MNKWKLVSFYTRDFYTQKYETFIKSVESVGVRDYVISSYPSLGWTNAVKSKPKFILDRLLETSDDIVWVDIDAVFHYYPSLFDNIKGDLAFGLFDRSHVELEPEVFAGTMYFRNNERVVKLVRDWVVETGLSSDLCPEQEAMRELLLKRPEIEVTHLPYDYYTIFDYRRGKSPIIEHFQASRFARINEMALSQYDKEVESEQNS